ncbi:hypothetical protein L7F22_018847, partial [Adiantum nelumboides]|nr:hypothetical protein [Adiantum nelumboides]
MHSVECSKVVARRAMAATQASSMMAWLCGSRKHYVTPAGVGLRATSPSSIRQSKRRGLCIVANTSFSSSSSSSPASSSSSFLAEPSSARRTPKAAPATPNEKLVKLRERLTTEGIDAYIIPSEDPHQ